MLRPLYLPIRAANQPQSIAQSSRRTTRPARRRPVHAEETRLAPTIRVRSRHREQVPFALGPAHPRHQRPRSLGRRRRERRVPAGTRPCRPAHCKASLPGRAKRPSKTPTSGHRPSTPAEEAAGYSRTTAMKPAPPPRPGPDGDAPRLVRSRAASRSKAVRGFAGFAGSPAREDGPSKRACARDHLLGDGRARSAEASTNSAASGRARAPEPRQTL